jgi:hypothetical protein
MYGLSLGDTVEVVDFNFPSGKHLTKIAIGDLGVVDNFEHLRTDMGAGIVRARWIQVNFEDDYWFFAEGSVQLISPQMLISRPDEEYLSLRKM